MKLTIYYSVQNGGDGSAYPRLMESMELAEFDQEHMVDTWGENCVGSITLESDTTIKCLDDVETKEAYLIDHYYDAYNAGKRKKGKAEFVAKFFPNGLPSFSVKTEQVNNVADYMNNLVFVDGKYVAKSFRSLARSGQAFEDLLNSQED